MKRYWLSIAVGAMALCSFAQIGYPQRENIKGLYQNFVNPPAGYGEDPFYWWQGDTLTRERLTWHLDEMAKKRVTSLQINYSHNDDKSQSYFWGGSVKSQPAQFTDEWWELFAWFAEEAAKRGMTVSVSDYTLGIGQGYALDEVAALHPDIRGQKLLFSTLTPEASGYYKIPSENPLVSVVAFSGDQHIDLTDKVNNGTLKWTVPDKQQWRVVATTAEQQPRSYNPMHPLAGKEYVRCFFQRFEDNVPANVKNNLNFFFSDELNFNLKMPAWDCRFADEFIKRKGYDIRPLLAALSTDIGALTTQVRLDYNDVFTSLSEENFFIPVYNWHHDRGLIYGCDHGGRGRVVDEFGDYFRTQRWNQGPGSDQPRFLKDVIKAKVAASIAHLYERPRVWLEGFYASGWGTNTEGLMDAIFANYAMGYNLLSLHGLYYATPDSRWEWAPPCNHFRMPYWPLMDDVLKTVERLSYLLSQGYHSCDIGIIYPVEPKVAGYGNKAVDAAFDAARGLYANGIDLDFIDYSSIAEAAIIDGQLVMANERYKAIVVPPMEVMRETTKHKLEEFAAKGGAVIHLLPGTEPDSLINVIDKTFSRDFMLLDKSDRAPYIQHRRMDDKHIYAVYDVDKGARCYFRAKGDVEIWNPIDGTCYKLTDNQRTVDGTVVKMPYERSQMQLIVFTPHSTAEVLKSGDAGAKILTLDNMWSCEMLPVLDNKFGDFHYPGTPELIKPEIRHYRYKETASGDLPKDDADSRQVTYTYGTEMLCSGATDQILSDEELSVMVEAPAAWTPYEFSRKWGVLGDAGHQGYHGLKSQQNPEVIRLGQLKREGTSTTRVAESGGTNYYLFTSVDAPHDGEFTILTGEVRPTRCFIAGNKLQDGQSSVRLKKGINTVVLHYDNPVISYFFLRDPAQPTVEAPQFALQWYNDPSVLAFDPYAGKGAKYGWYFFESAPGLIGLEVATNGKLTVWVDGKQQKVKTTADGQCTVLVSPVHECAVPVALRVKLPFGIKGGNAIASDLIQNTAKGKIATGDWGKTDGLRNYSGGIVYTQDVNIPASAINGDRLYLCADTIVAAASLRVNGKDAGVKICPDWRFDITDFVTAGDNVIEITVYNTAANHYETIPTPYYKYTPSGIIGDVWIEK